MNRPPIIFGLYKGLDSLSPSIRNIRRHPRSRIMGLGSRGQVLLTPPPSRTLSLKLYVHVRFVGAWNFEDTRVSDTRGRTIEP